MNRSREPLVRLLQAAARTPEREAGQGPLGWESRVLRAVQEQRSAGVSQAFAALWRQGVVWAFATAVVVSSVSVWNMSSAGAADPERQALEPVEIYQVMR